MLLTRTKLLAAVLTSIPLGAAHGQANDLFPFGDEFSDAARAAEWTHRHAAEGLGFDPLEVWEIDGASAPGAMRLVPYTVTWYAGYKGPLVYKSVDGDFALTTRVAVSNRAGAGLPSSSYSLGGLMLRAPTAAPAQPEDYVFLSLGYVDPAQWPAAGPGPHFEVKSTDNGVSTLEGTSANVFEAQLQLARIGGAVVALYRRPNEAWVVHRRYARADLPATLQAGIVAYTDWPKVSTYTPAFHNANLLAPPIAGDPSTQPGLPFAPDLDARFDYARFQRIAAPPGFDALTASEPELLALLGENANSTQATYCTATTSSNGCVASLTGSGTASASGAGAYLIRANGVDGQRAGLVFYGLSGASAAPWGTGGFLCVKAPTQRTGSQSSGGASLACDGELALDWNAFVAAHGGALGGPFQGGETVWAQAWWRDPPSAKSTALSDGLAFVVAP
jgi:hypothetical protein